MCAAPWSLALRFYVEISNGMSQKSRPHKLWLSAVAGVISIVHRVLFFSGGRDFFVCAITYKEIYFLAAVCQRVPPRH